jgi:1,4-alpha-glucan branching enzyme
MPLPPGGSHHFFDFANKKIIFYFHNHHARRVTVAGSFNSWQTKQFAFTHDENRLWTLEFRCCRRAFIRINSLLVYSDGLMTRKIPIASRMIQWFEQQAHHNLGALP